MIKTRLILASGAAMLLSAACTDEVPEIPASELYTREFVKEFGVIDSRQDWNNASRGSVQVSTSTPSRVKVTAVISNHNYLLADYEDVQGKRTLGFDIPKGVTRITVSDGTTEIDTKVGGSVDFASASRGGTVTPGDDFIKVEDITDAAYHDDWMIVPWIDATRFTRKMPEQVYNGDRPGVSTDFLFKSQGTSVIVRPLYWQTSQRHTMGFYYLGNDGEIVKVPVYEMEKTSTAADDLVYSLVVSNVIKVELSDNDADVKEYFPEGLSNLAIEDNVTESGVGPQTLAAISDINGRLTELLKKRADTGTEGQDDYKPYSKFYYLYRWTNVDLSDKDKNPKPQLPAGRLDAYFTYRSYGQHSGAGGANEPYASSDNWQSVLSKGVKVTFKEPGTKFGAYIDCSDKHSYYSIASRNYDRRYVPKKEAYREGGAYDGKYVMADGSDAWTDEGKKEGQPHAATWLGTKYGWKYFGFEDWPNGDKEWGGHSSDMDLNDFVFIIEGADVVPNPNKEAEPITWLIACEDLGNKDDFDFNDVVFEYQHVSGQGTATITPLAAGGTMETYLMRKNIDGTEEQIGGEWHGNFDGAPHTEMINTTTITKTAKPITILVRPDLTLASSTEGTGADSNDNYSYNMGGFFLKVIRDGNKETTITPPGVGEAPQMLLIYQGINSRWSWPKERQNIKDAYSGFELWMQGKTYDVYVDGENWFDKAETGFVVNR